MAKSSLFTASIIVGIPIAKAMVVQRFKADSSFKANSPDTCDCMTCDNADAYIAENCQTPAPTPCPPGDEESCQAWADPHISGFDTKSFSGPDYLSLVGTEGQGKTLFKTYFDSFDKRRSQLYRKQKPENANRTKQVEETRPAPEGDDNPDEEMDVNAYDSGDFWLVKSIPIHIQGRFRLAQEFLPDNAAIGAVAIGGPFMGGHSIIIEPLDGDTTLDGVPMPLGSFTQSSEAGNLTMQYFDSPKGKVGLEHADFDADLPMGVKLKLRRWSRHLDIKITLPKDIPGGVDGECGNMNGKAEDDGQGQIKDRMGVLEIDKPDKLFMKSFKVWVDFDKQGFEAVQATGENRTMERFVRLLLANRGAQLMSESDLSGLLPYYTGQEEKRTYYDLLDELSDADWVKGYDTDGSWFFGPVGRLVDQVRKSIIGSE